MTRRPLTFRDFGPLGLIALHGRLHWLPHMPMVKRGKAKGRAHAAVGEDPGSTPVAIRGEVLSLHRRRWLADLRAVCPHMSRWTILVSSA